MFHKSVSEKQEYRNNNRGISGYKGKQGFKGSVIECSKDERHRKDMIDAKRELQEIKESIDAARDRLNKMVSQDERIQLTTEEIIKVSRQLDILIQDYNRKSAEVQEKLKLITMLRIDKYNLKPENNTCNVNKN